MRPECRLACAPYCLALPGRPLAGSHGERLGRGTGSSLEFVDFRDYQWGDDLRHIDWRGYARTDQLKVRLYREEIAPSVEVLVDGSASMASTDAKARALRDLAGACAHWSRRIGGRPRIQTLGGRDYPDAEAVPLGGDDAREWQPLVPLRPRSLRVVLSDFMSPLDPGPAIRRLASGAAHVYVVQLLDPWELAPDDDGMLTLIDCESGERLELRLDREAIDEYRARLDRLRAAVRRATLAAGGTYACVRAANPVTMFREDLLSQGIVEVA